ncbi:ABC transporter permease [uncultured Bacteroides sp.]|uniref:ABC transporter permease n=1 Tax=uncultured Bacteroides sp. TaxID=162156 RepID=UPI00260BD1F6|nr:ABC transporter permease [uncultured Bacteroides sp.]
MKFDLDTFNEILLTITRNKTRSLLTAFGVFWGIFMLVTLMGGGNGFKALMSTTFEGFAQNSAFVWPQRTGEAYKGFRKGRWWNLEQTDMVRVRQIEGVDIVTCVQNRWGVTAVYQDKKSEGAIVKGLYPEYNSIEDQKVKYGRFINDIDILEKRKVCFIGKKVSEELFGKDVNPCGKLIKADGIYYQVIGMAGDTNSNMQINGSADESLSIPFSTYAAAYNIGSDIGLMCLTMKPGYKVTERQPYIESVIKQHHLIHPDDTQCMQFLNAEALFSMVDSLFKSINMLVWMIGLGTLISGVIGVSNIMMVTVKERTTEIGIRRAIGATPRTIMEQILTESMVLTLIAGMTGISFSVFLLQMMNLGMEASNQPANFQVSFGMAVGAAIMVVILGVTAGIAPAYRAMSIKPIEAIRDE